MPAWTSYTMLTFIVFLALVAGAAFFGGQWSAGAWYRSLSKPIWTPPNWLFPAVWTLLYAMMAVAGLLVWNTPHENRTALLALWGVQLVLNALWSYIFFGRRDMRLALFDIISLWLAIAAFILLAWPANELAAMLFMPYLVWVSYATALNANIWLRNPQKELTFIVSDQQKTKADPPQALAESLDSRFRGVRYQRPSNEALTTHP